MRAIYQKLAEKREIQKSGLFDPVYYLFNNDDVRAADVEPLSHFLKTGWREGRNPNPFFDVKYYLEENPDLRVAGVNPLIHYLKTGWRESRNPSSLFDNDAYIRNYISKLKDLQNPLVHFLKTGQKSGTKPIPVNKPAFSYEMKPKEPEEFDLEAYLRYLRTVQPPSLTRNVYAPPLVSVIITSFNHEKYIRQCLESVMKQKGDFELEIIVGDDHSTDGTRKIHEEFQEKYPNVFKILPLEKNLGVTKNLKRCLDACKGQYIAICEGDDYWIDPYKLQKQVFSLETNPELSMVFSAILLLIEENQTYRAHNEVIKVEGDRIGTADLIRYNYIGNFSCCMYRHTFVQALPEALFDLYTVDWMFNISCSEFGDIGYLSDYMSVYRLHQSGSWTGKTQIEKLADLSDIIVTYDNFLKQRHHDEFMDLKGNVDQEIKRLKSLTEPDARLV